MTQLPEDRRQRAERHGREVAAVKRRDRVIRAVKRAVYDTPDPVLEPGQERFVERIADEVLRVLGDENAQRGVMPHASK